MSNSTFTTATLRSRTLGTAGFGMCDSSMLGRTAVWTHASRPATADAVPAIETGRGCYANAKQDRPPRGELR